MFIRSNFKINGGILVTIELHWNYRNTFDYPTSLKEFIMINIVTLNFKELVTITSLFFFLIPVVSFKHLTNVYLHIFLLHTQIIVKFNVEYIESQT